MAAIPLYTQTIASLHGLDPAFPAQLGVLNLDKAIAAGSPMHIGDLEHAEAVALVLDGYSKVGDAHFTADMAAKANRRVNKIATAHANAIYVDAPGDIGAQMAAITDQITALNAVMNQRFNVLEAQNVTFSKMVAHAANARTISRNLSSTLIDSFIPLYKSVTGSGLLLAQGIKPQAHAPLAEPDIIPLIGTLPPNFHPRLSDYSHTDILDFVIFYNDTFGIVPGHNLKRRVELFGLYLRTH